MKSPITTGAATTTDRVQFHADCACVSLKYASGRAARCKQLCSTIFDLSISEPRILRLDNGDVMLNPVCCVVEGSDAEEVVVDRVLVKLF